MDNDLIVFSGRANPKKLAERICEYLDVRLGQALVDDFSDGETRVELQERTFVEEMFLSSSQQVHRRISTSWKLLL